MPYIVSISLRSPRSLPSLSYSFIRKLGLWTAHCNGLTFVVTAGVVQQMDATISRRYLLPKNLAEDRPGQCMSGP